MPLDRDPSPGTLVKARGRDWVVLPGSSRDFVVVRPLSGDDLATTAVYPELEDVDEARFERPTPADIGTFARADLLRTALRIGFRSSAGPFRSLAGISVEPRQYQLVPLLLALKQEVTRLLIADDVGIGKSIEAGLIAKELFEQGTVERMTVLCSPALAEQWEQELRDKFGFDPVVVSPSTVRRLQRLAGNDSIFQAFPVTVVSTDFIKAEARSSQFIANCPELVIVDEAHTCVPDVVQGTKNPKQQRYDLVKQIAADEKRHLLLVTATPHNGKEDCFRLLIGLLDPTLAGMDLEMARNRDRLAAHMVQRRRRDIRKFIDQETNFPKDRLAREVEYNFGEAYGELYREIVAYARETVREPSGQIKPRTQWWAALGLLRAFASSPGAGANALLKKAAGAEAQTDDEADALGEAAVMDRIVDDGADTDLVPGADPVAQTPQTAAERRDRRRREQWAERARSLANLQTDAKLAALHKAVAGLLSDGYNPIVFCRYLATAHYVGDSLEQKFGKLAAVTTITSELPPDERTKRIEDLSDEVIRRRRRETPAKASANSEPKAARRILVATDCLSEGVNLQEHFDAVVHYDLAWNPTRHEQREGRVDRFGQRTEYVRAVTMHGTDNGVDSLVLNVLIRKHQAIRKRTGVIVPVPDGGKSLMTSLFEELLKGEVRYEQGTLDFDEPEQVVDQHDQWTSIAEAESKAITKYAHTGSGLAQLQREVQEEVAEIRASLGDSSQIPDFVRWALGELGAQIQTDADGSWIVTVAGLPPGLKQALGASGASGRSPELMFRAQPPAARNEAVLLRTDPKVGEIARYVLDSALDRNIKQTHRPASRCGATRTPRVSERTVLLLARYRFHMSLPRPGKQAPKRSVAEDSRIFGFRGQPSAPDWLTQDEVAELLALTPADLRNLADDQARGLMERLLDRIDAIVPTLNESGLKYAAQLAASHTNVRQRVGVPASGIDVEFQPSADILGVYAYYPVPQLEGDAP